MSHPKTKTPAIQDPGVADWFTPREIQRELRIGERLCYRLLKTGEIPSVRVGKLYRVRRETVNQLRDSAMIA